VVAGGDGETTFTGAGEGDEDDAKEGLKNKEDDEDNAGGC